MMLWQTNPALATAGVYTSYTVKAINPPPKVPESTDYLIITKCGDNPCKTPKKILPTQQQIDDINNSMNK